MEMVEVKTAELVGPALDWAVAKAEHLNARLRNGVFLTLQNGFDYMPYGQGESGGIVEGVEYRSFSPSSSWAQAGPLIEKFRFCFDNAGEYGFAVVKDWYCGEPISFYPSGDTHLLAACRAIVASKLGSAVSVPKELMK